MPAGRADRYAMFFRVKPEWLLYGKTGDATLTQLGPQIYVVGEVQAGVFKTAWRQEPDNGNPSSGAMTSPFPLGSGSAYGSPETQWTCSIRLARS